MQRAGGCSRALTVGIAMLLFYAAPVAAAQAQAPGFESPSLNQYVESVPTGGGASGTPETGKAPQPRLAASVQRAIRTRGGSDANALVTVSTSAALGAPSQSQPQSQSQSTTGASGSDHQQTRSRQSSDRTSERPSTALSRTPDEPSTLAAFGAALKGGGGVPLLVILLAAVTGAMLAARLRGRRNS